MKAMIFAAGLGTRLKPITDHLPKALVPLHGKTLLDHVVDKLHSADIHSFVINVHHFSQMIVDYVHKSEYSSEFLISDESQALLETGGGIQHARELLLHGVTHDEPFLVHNVDILSNLDLKWFMGQWKKEMLALLLVSERTTQRYLLFNDDMRLVGWTNIATGEVKSPFKNLDVNSCHKYAFSGIHLISNSVFEVMENEGMPERFSIIDFYLKVAASYPIHAVVQNSLKLIDVGKVAVLEELEKQELF